MSRLRGKENYMYFELGGDPDEAPQEREVRLWREYLKNNGLSDPEAAEAYIQQVMGDRYPYEIEQGKEDGQ